MLRPSGATSSEIHDPSDVSNAIVRSPSSGRSFFSFLSAGSSCFSCARNVVLVPRRTHPSRQTLSSDFMNILPETRTHAEQRNDSRDTDLRQSPNAFTGHGSTRITEQLHGTRIHTDHETASRDADPRESPN